ncbi:amino acid permease [Anaeromyxobacter oryzae]|uniref:Amino acid permease n=2 Tax=Anaeromyxobacter oryzae TaxID=2918170 RepID=A0ABM7WWD3_9BACT|nr:amino acid permease [Anaeromyxobacter oryzae]
MRPMNARSAGKLTLWPGVGLVAANMIGAGVFLSTGFMAQSMSPGPILLAWVVGALLALAGARAYADVARLVPRSGGEYRYLSDLLHPSLGFIAGWASLLVGFSAPVAADALAAGEFARTVFPRLGATWIVPVGPGVAVTAAQVLGAALIVLLTTFHAVGLRTSARVQNGLIVVKALLLAGFVVVGLVYGQRSWPTWTAGAPGAGFPAAAFASSLFFIAFAFSGWNAAVYAAEEFEKPERTVPRAMIVGCLLVAGLYLVVNFIFVANLTPADATVVFRYDTDRVTLGHAVITRLLGPGSGAVMSLFTVAVFISAMSAMTFVGPRVYAAMAKDGYLPAALRGEDGKPPVGAIVLQGALAVAILFTHPLRDILENLGAILTFFAALTAAGLFKVALARRGGARPRPSALVAAGVYVVATIAMFVYSFRLSPGSLRWVAGAAVVGLLGWLVSRPRARHEVPPAAAPGA